MEKAPWKEPPKIIWTDGRHHPAEENVITPLYHGLNYSNAAIEGIKAHPGADGYPLVLALDAHIDRLYNTAKLCGFEIPYSKKDFRDEMLKYLRATGLKGVIYIRPIVAMGEGPVGVSAKNKIRAHMIAFEPTAYIEADVAKTMVSSQRISVQGFPEAKSSDKYALNQRAGRDARDHDYDEAIILNEHGYVAEGPGQNIGAVIKRYSEREPRIITPPVHDGALPGITMGIVEMIVRKKGIGLSRETLTLGTLITGKEAFYTGTYTGPKAIGSVGRKPIGDGGKGQLTSEIDRAYNDWISRRTDDLYDELTPVY